MSEHETCFEIAAGNLRFGPHATQEVGQDAAALGLKRVLLFTDRVVRGLPPFETTCRSLRQAGIAFDVFDAVRIEPSEASFQQAIDAAASAAYDGFVAVGGGSTIDTAKAANLYATWPADFLTYVNAPLGEGKPVPGPLRPLIAIPTTAGTGSEATGVAIFDCLSVKAKTGIAHRRLRPTLGIVDPENLRTLPRLVAASSGIDVICHALESYTAIPYTARQRPAGPLLRPAYQGSNPVADVWSLQALRLAAQYLPRLCADPSDAEARQAMGLAAAYAGIGFGNAGVHLCHGMSYPVSSLVRDYRAPGYPQDHPLVPHGISVALCAPAVFRFTGCAAPQRHLEALAALLGRSVQAVAEEVPAGQAGEALAQEVAGWIRRLGLPNGLAALGFTREDAPALARGTLPQHRVTRLSPRPADESDLQRLFEASLEIWPAASSHASGSGAAARASSSG
ncbi:MAG: iron-containing alcohol dehydrogenase [Pirellulales bacterium]|nr:iron-containing alcohol dehydrogenase [Pirellulales bacterium]